MANFKERKQRFFEEFEKKEDIYLFLRSNFSGNKRMKIKYDVEERELFINEFVDAGQRVNQLPVPFFCRSIGAARDAVPTSGVADKVADHPAAGAPRRPL